MRSPALISTCSKAGCYAVLASLSGRYPPLEGRSPTCYSPVRHSVVPCGTTAFDLHVLGTPPALILSQDQTLKLKRLFSPEGESNSITRAPVELGSCVVPYSCRLPLIPLPGFTGAVARLRLALTRSASSRQADTRRAPAERHTPSCRNLACTHYLVFKEPSPPRGNYPPSGEPSEVTIGLLGCQPLF